MFLISKMFIKSYIITFFALYHNYKNSIGIWYLQQFKYQKVLEQFKNIKKNKNAVNEYERFTFVLNEDESYDC